MRIHGQALPKEWKKFLSNVENIKSRRDLRRTWSEVETSCLKGVKVFLAHYSMCHSLSPANEENDPVMKIAESGQFTEQEDAAVYKKSLQATSDLSPPVGHAWQMEEEELTIHWINLPLAPDSVTELA
ncbi:hypothetical protein HOLleu_02806 [Holothuria leucospilota]|uniref:Uncharacterized protein n=1 Tax=Holothuria leucospilota TaxID=206669 RepID=A0A9Q1CQ38_HOLLE|nr:hypothetical protein HOLleu_02806 [Holothuria leucospilota]